MFYRSVHTSASLKQNPPCTSRFEPTRRLAWLARALGAGPVILGLVQLINSKSRTYSSSKNFWESLPPNTNIFLLSTKLADCPYLPEGDPEPSGPWYQVIVDGSNACKSLKHWLFSPLPPK